MSIIKESMTSAPGIPHTPIVSALLPSAFPSSHMPLAAIATGSFSLDRATGVGGYPRGRLTELFGEEGSGKTALALHAAAGVQRTGGVAAVIDLEGAVSPAVARLAGVNPDRLFLSRPSCGEEALEICQMLLRSNEIDLIALDSAAALCPRSEAAGRAENPLPADWIGPHLRRVAALLPQSRTCLLFTNQTRRNLYRAGGASETTPGGQALRLLSALRIELHRAGTYQDHPGGEATGIRVRARVVKNKLAAPFAQAGFWLDFAHGLDRDAELLAFGRRAGLVQRLNGVLFLGKIALGPDRVMARERLRCNNEWRRMLEEQLLHAWNGNSE